MENASDALIMAGQVLIFIIALTVCISSFTTIRVGIDNVIDQSETIKLAKESDLYVNYIQSRDEKSTRIVGAETVVSSLYRSIKENYTLYLILSEPYSTITSKFDEYNKIDEDSETTNRKYKIVYQKDIANNQLIVKFTIGAGSNSIPDTILKIGLYDEIKDRLFHEYLGEYQNNTDASSENKLTNRIITYVEKKS